MNCICGMVLQVAIDKWIKLGEVMNILARGLTLSIITIGVVSTTVFAGQVEKPYTFSNGSPADATQVNANFDTLYSQVNTNTSNIAKVSVPKLSVYMVEKSLNYNISSSYVSEVMTASCASGEVLTGGTCGCMTQNSDFDTTNIGTLASCIMSGNVVYGACYADTYLSSKYKYGPPVIVTAACMSLDNPGLAKSFIRKEGTPDAEAQQMVDEFSKQINEYAKIIEKKIESQSVQP